MMAKADSLRRKQSRRQMQAEYEGKVPEMYPEPSGGGTDVDEAPSTLEAAVAAVKQGLFGVLFVMAKDVTVNNPLALLLVVVDFIQLLSFPLSDSKLLPWHEQSAVSGFSSVLTFISASAADTVKSPAVFYVSLTWVAGVLACAAWVAHSFITENFSTMLHVKVLRTVATLSTTALFIPLVSNLMAVYRCPDTFWMGTGIRCDGQLHVFLVVVVTLLVLIFGLFSVVVVACFFDRDPRSHNILSRAHGRVEAGMLVLKAALTLLFTVETALTAWVLIGGLIIASTAYLHFYLHYLPFYRQSMNRLQVAFASVFAATTLCLAVAHIRQQPEHNTESFMWFLAAPLSAVIGVAMVDWRFARFGQAIPLNSPYMVELKARHMLQDVAVTVSSRRFGKVVKKEVNEDDSDTHTERLEEVEELWRDALEFFPSSLSYVFIAHFVHCFRSNRGYVERMHLSSAEARKPPLDVAFLLFQRRRQIRLEEARGTGQAGMSVIARIRFEQSQTESTEHDLRARELQMEFWRELGLPTPNLTSLSQIGREIEVSVSKATTAYQLMRSLNPASVTVMRNFAQFLMDVANRPDKATKLLTEADDMEERMAKEDEEKVTVLVFNAVSAELEIEREDVGVVSLGAHAEDLGIIKSLSAVAVRAFGYPRREVVGKSIDMLLPSPFDVSHQVYMEHFLETGVEKVVNVTRTVFGRNKYGAIFPVKLNVRPMEDTFAGVMQVVDSPDNYFIVSSRTLRITAACGETLSMLGLEGTELEEDAVLLSSVLDEGDFREAFQQAAETVEIANGLPKVRLMKPFYTSFTHVNPAYAASRSAADPLNFETRRASRPQAQDSQYSSLRVWLRMQITTYGIDGTAFSDHGLPFEQDLEQTSIGRTAPKPLGTRTDVDNERMIVCTWNVAKDTKAKHAAPHHSSNASATSSENAGQAQTVARCPFAAASRKLGKSGLGSSGAHRLTAAVNMVSAAGGTPRVAVTGSEPQVGPGAGAGTGAGAGAGAGVGAGAGAGAQSNLPQVTAGQGSPTDSMSSGSMRPPSTDSLELPSSINPPLLASAPAAADEVQMVRHGTDTSDDIVPQVAEPAPRRRSTERVSFGVPPSVTSSPGSVPHSVKNLEDELMPKSSKVAPAPEGHSISGSTVKSVASVFHKAMERGSTEEEPTLRRLRKVLYAVVLCGMVLALTCLMVSRDSFLEIHKDIDYYGLEAKRVLSSQGVSALVEALSYNGAGSHRHYNETVAILAAEADLLEHAHTTLTSSVPYVSTEHYIMFNVPDVPVTFVDGNLTQTPVEWRITTRNMTATDLTAQFISSVKLIATASEQSFATQQRHVQFVIRNGDKLQSVFRDSFFARFSTRGKRIADVDALLLGVSVGAIVVLVLFTFGMVLPITVQVMTDSTYRLFSVFLCVPVPIIRILHRRAKSSFETMQAAVHGEEEADMLELNHADSDGDDGVDFASMNFQNIKQRAMKREWMPTLVLFLKIGVPLLLGASYFLMDYLIISASEQEVLRQEDSLLESESREMMPNVMMTELMRGMHAPSVEVAAARAVEVQESATTLLDSQTALLMGHNGLTASISAGGALGELMNRDGCLPVADVAFCRAFEDGVMTQGLHTALLHFVDRALAMANTMTDPDFFALPLQRKYEHPNWVFVDRLHPMLLVGLEYATRLRLNLGDDQVEDTVTKLEVLLACYILVFVAVLLFFYRPTLHRLDRTTKRSRAMLLLFPDTVLTGVPQVRQLVMDFLRRDGIRPGSKAAVKKKALSRL